MNRFEITQAKIKIIKETAPNKTVYVSPDLYFSFSKADFDSFVIADIKLDIDVDRIGIEFGYTLKSEIENDSEKFFKY